MMGPEHVFWGLIFLLNGFVFTVTSREAENVAINASVGILVLLTFL